MASHSEPRILSFKASGDINVGEAVKPVSADRETVEVCSANSDAAIGVAQGSIDAADATAGVRIEIALQGGGAKGKAGETITAGKFLVPAADGKMEQTNASGDRIIGMAMEDAVAGDVFAMEVMNGVAVGADE